MASSELELEKMPYQKFKDSPTIKYYTDWATFDELLGYMPEGTVGWIDIGTLKKSPTILLKPDGFEYSGINDIGVEKFSRNALKLYDLSEGKVYAKHFLRIDKYISLLIKEGEKRNVKLAIIPPKKGSSSHHLSIKLERSASLNLEVIYAPISESSLSSFTLEIDGEGENKIKILNLVKAQNNSPFFYETRILGRGKDDISVRTATSGGIIHNRADIVILGSMSKANIKALSLVTNNNRADLTTNILNDSSQGIAEILVRGINAGGEIVHRGTLKAETNSIESENKLRSYLIKTSKNSINHSVPILEITTNLIKTAEHSTDISDIPEDILFYLSSRGLKREEAVFLLTQSMLIDMVEDLFENSNEAIEWSNNFLKNIRL
ncbi:SufD family Fe-S cluster assembly protein [Fervidicoccus fontis]|uniref:SufD family Fe-S cluster assembly protein n=1 Tax=Fervidicoccus fontis TaxID=683846 RepID=A0A843ADW9_9CREN|nr:SufD family Fe-S cluster assembly protein [Fervidicoccus fontis]MBE9391327.1 SufD family Fe-S cluster assembly protein [Fervidicoccus fontis]